MHPDIESDFVPQSLENRGDLQQFVPAAAIRLSIIQWKILNDLHNVQSLPENLLSTMKDI